MIIISQLLDNKLRIAYFFAYFITVIISVIIIHESAHFLAALAIGVPFNEIKVGLIGTNPGITIPERFSNAPLGIYHYAGGFLPALLLSFVYILWYRKYRKKPSNITWDYGTITISVIGMQLAQGYVEGRFHAAYILYSGSPFNVLIIFEVVIVAFAIFIHYQLFPISRINK
ncbi:hypothetical protein ACFLWI_02060 [Chloroflexota bacterium]